MGECVSLGGLEQETRKPSSKKIAARGDVTSSSSAASVTVMSDEERKPQVDLYCPRCHCAVTDPLICGDCSSIICRRCGTPLEQVDELGIG
jgi:hypothetical protein